MYEGNMRKIGRLFDTQIDALKAAKQRAKTRYRTQYIYEQEQDGRTVWYIRELIETERHPIIKVFYDGSDHDL